MASSFQRQPIPRWYWAAAAVSLVFMLLICAGYATNLLTDPATLALDDRAVYEAEPAWVSGAFGLTGLAGAVGAVLLFMRRKAAQSAMLVSLLAVAAWFAGLMLVS